MLNHKEMTKHIRSRLKFAGIKAKCSLYISCGVQWIKISVPEYGYEWSQDEAKKIAFIAKCNKLTLARGMEINENFANLSGQFDFCMPV